MHTMQRAHRALARWLHAWQVWVPCVLILAIALPNVTFMIPATRDYLEEVYQPLQALKFFKSHGKAFHKYGPMPNFLLAPGTACRSRIGMRRARSANPPKTIPTASRIRISRSGS